MPTWDEQDPWFMTRHFGKESFDHVAPIFSDTFQRAQFRKGKDAQWWKLGETQFQLFNIDAPVLESRGSNHHSMEGISEEAWC